MGVIGSGVGEQAHNGELGHACRSYLSGQGTAYFPPCAVPRLRRRRMRVCGAFPLVAPQWGAHEMVNAKSLSSEPCNVSDATVHRTYARAG